MVEFGGLLLVVVRRGVGYNIGFSDWVQKWFYCQSDFGSYDRDRRGSYVGIGSRGFMKPFLNKHAYMVEKELLVG